jgi:hypothetical protein
VPGADGRWRLIVVEGEQSDRRLVLVASRGFLVGASITAPVSGLPLSLDFVERMPTETNEPACRICGKPIAPGDPRYRVPATSARWE